MAQARVLEDLDSHEDIARLTDRLLRKADAYGRLPTPVEDILAAANLKETPDTFLSEGSIATMPAHLRGVLRRVSGKVHAALDGKTRVVHINPATDLVGQQAFKRLRDGARPLPVAAHRRGPPRVRRQRDDATADRSPGI